MNCDRKAFAILGIFWDKFPFLICNSNNICDKFPLLIGYNIVHSIQKSVTSFPKDWICPGQSSSGHEPLPFLALFKFDSKHHAAKRWDLEFFRGV